MNRVSTVLSIDSIGAVLGTELRRLRIVLIIFNVLFTIVVPYISINPP